MPRRRWPKAVTFKAVDCWCKTACAPSNDHYDYEKSPKEVICPAGLQRMITFPPRATLHFTPVARAGNDTLELQRLLRVPFLYDKTLDLIKRWVAAGVKHVKVEWR